MFLAMARCLVAIVSLTTLSPLIALTKSSSTEVRMVPPTHIVGVGVWLILHIYNRLCVERACANVMMIVTSHIVRFSVTSCTACIELLTTFTYDNAMNWRNFFISMTCPCNATTAFLSIPSSVFLCFFCFLFLLVANQNHHHFIPCYC